MTSAGSFACEKVIIAANGFAHLLDGGRTLGVKRGQMPLIVRATVTEPISGSSWVSAGWPRKCSVNVLSQLFYSFAPTPDGRVLWVGGYNTYASGPRDALADSFPVLGQDHVIGNFFPRLNHLRSAREWGGPISITADWIPHIGFAPSDARIAYAWGCWGSGMPI